MYADGILCLQFPNQPPGGGNEGPHQEVKQFNGCEVWIEWYHNLNRYKSFILMTNQNNLTLK